LRHGKGIEDIARVISGPSEGLHVLELFQSSADGAAPSYGAGAAQSDGLSIVGRERAWDERLDARARTAYRARYRQLTEALEEARERNDAGHIERCQDELERLLAELSQRRYTNSPAIERARKAVYNRLHAAIRRLERLDRELGLYLRRTISTGSYCCYRPELLQCLTCVSALPAKAAKE
jgi:hypothetical protein